MSDGVELHALQVNDGGGNFHLRPNGVVEMRSDGKAAVVVSTAYDPTGVEFATFFADELGCADALYLDGDISRPWVAGEGGAHPRGSQSGSLRGHSRGLATNGHGRPTAGGDCTGGYPVSTTGTSA